MDKYRITLTQRATDDIIGIGDYIAFQLLQPDTSENFIKGLRHYKNFYVFYEVIEITQVVIILRVGYSKRNWKDILT